jgi:hypothetical protein
MSRKRGLYDENGYKMNPLGSDFENFSYFNVPTRSGIMPRFFLQPIKEKCLSIMAKPNTIA